MATLLLLFLQLSLAGKSLNFADGVVTACNSSLLFFKPGVAKYEVVDLKEKIVDFAIGSNLYVITDRHLLSIDPATKEILNKNYAPYHYSALLLLPSKTGQDSLLILLGSDEISLVQPQRLSYLNGIGIPPGDRAILFTPLDNHLYLNLKKLDHSIIEVYNLKSGRRESILRTDLVKEGLYDHHSEHIYLLDSSGGLKKTSARLKQYKKIFNVSMPATRMYQDNLNLVVITPWELYLIELKSGKLLDSKPMVVDGSLLIPMGKIITFRQPDRLFGRGGLCIIDLETLTIVKHMPWRDSIQSYFLLDENNLVIENDNCFFKLVISNGVTDKLAPSHIFLKPKKEELLVGDSCYYIQIGAFSQADLAKATLQDLIAKGIPAFCDSSTNLFKIRIGGFANHEEAYLFSCILPYKNWLVYTDKYFDSTMLKERLVPVNDQKTVLVYRFYDGSFDLVFRSSHEMPAYSGSAIMKDSVIELKRVDGKKSYINFKNGGFYEEIQNNQD